MEDALRAEEAQPERPRAWGWWLARAAVGFAVAAPIVIVGVNALAGDDGHRGQGGDAPRPPAAAPSAPAPATSSPAPPACPESGLSVRPGHVDAAMGLRVLQIVVTNCGTEERTVRGHPTVALLDEDREPIDVTATPGSSGVATVAAFDAEPATVTLEPGEWATSALLWRNKVTDASVRATNGRYVVVTVSAGDEAQVIEPEGGIDLGTTVRLGVAPWTAHR